MFLAGCATTGPVTPGASLRWTFDTDLEDWTPGVVDDVVGGAGWGTSQWRSWCGTDRPRGCVMLDGVGGEGQPNAWIANTVALPADVTTLRFDTSAHNRDLADSSYRVRLIDAADGEHVLVPWSVTSGAEDVYNWSTVTVPIGAFAGQTVTLLFEGADNGPGFHEQRYYDDIEID